MKPTTNVFKRSNNRDLSISRSFLILRKNDKINVLTHRDEIITTA